jgi:PAS domain S-box-containing protein
LPPRTLIIFSNVSSDITGKSFVPRDVVKVLASKSNAPILSMFSTQIDTGVIGGAMIDMELVGGMIANLMLALESGKPVETALPSSYIQPMFNWTQIERWGVDPDRLPPGSVFINRPLTLWGQYKTAVVVAMLVILILTAMTGALIVQNRRRKLAEISVRESADQLVAERDLLEERVNERTAHLTEALEFNETMLLNSPVPMGIYAENGQCVMVNEAYARFVGATREELLAQNFNKLLSWQQTTLLGDCLAAMKLQTPQQREVHTVTSYGKDVWFEYRILPRLSARV